MKKLIKKYNKYNHAQCKTLKECVKDANKKMKPHYEQLMLSKMPSEEKNANYQEKSLDEFFGDIDEFESDAGEKHYHQWLYEQLSDEEKKTFDEDKRKEEEKNISVKKELKKYIKKNRK